MTRPDRIQAVTDAIDEALGFDLQTALDNTGQSSNEGGSMSLGNDDLCWRCQKKTPPEGKELCTECKAYMKGWGQVDNGAGSEWRLRMERAKAEIEATGSATTLPVDLQPRVTGNVQMTEDLDEFDYFGAWFGG